MYVFYLIHRMPFRYFTSAEVSQIVTSSCKSLCLFASYEPPESDFISADNVQYIRSLATCFDTVVVLTNWRFKEICNRNDLPNNVNVVSMENVCYDFGLWFRFLYNLDVTNIQRIGIVNDSCTLLNAKKLETILQSTNAPFWGMTDSYERETHHIQSYFLIFEQEGITHFMDFVRNGSDISSYVNKTKSDIVNDFELGLSRFMASKKVPLQAVLPYSTIFNVQSRWNTFSSNASYGMWDRLLIAGMPILKKARAHFEDEDNFIAMFRSLRD